MKSKPALAAGFAFLYFAVIIEAMSEIKIIAQKDFPPLLREIPDTPEQLYIKGELPNTDMPWIAIVGTRKATPDGILLAKQLAKELAEKGFVIVSGLAMGIDTAAHEGALKGNGKTIAVLGNGLASIYPRQNENLAKQIIAQGGALLSEYTPEIPAYPNQFLERNRIVSGLCAATIVIEAPDRSGSIVTARLAGEQGREIFVFPGPAGHPNYAGSHNLIRDGARLVTSVTDILEDLGFEELPPQPFFKENPSTSLRARDIHNGASELSPHERAILTVIGSTKKSLSIDKIAELTKLDAAIINPIVALHTLSGTLQEDEFGYRRVTDKS